MLTIKNLTLYQNKKKITLIDSLSIKEGEWVSIVGESGSGKSTFFKSLVGLHAEKKGSILFKGSNIENKKTFEIISLGISYLPQVHLLFPTLTVRDHLELALYAQKKLKDKSVLLERIFLYFPLLKACLNRFVSFLSGGEKQILSLGCCLITSPSLLILDELSLGLSPFARKRVREVLLSFVQGGGAIILSEQSSNDFARCSKRILTLKEDGLLEDKEF